MVQVTMPKSTDISASTGKFDSNEQVGVFLSRRSVQHLVSLKILFIVLYWIYLNTFVYLMICFKAVILFRDICYKVFITANMKNYKSHCRQEVDVRQTWKGETRYKSPCKSHISKHLFI
jgi:hypothetical protein